MLLEGFFDERIVIWRCQLAFATIFVARLCFGNVGGFRGRLRLRQRASNYVGQPITQSPWCGIDRCMRAIYLQISQMSVTSLYSLQA